MLGVGEAGGGRVDSKCWGKPMQSEDKLEGGGGDYMSTGRLGSVKRTIVRSTDQEKTIN